MTNKSSKFLKITAFIFLVGLLLGGALYLYEEYQDEFSPENISYDFASQLPPQPVYSSNVSVENLLSQPLHYIGKGHQSYVFGSDQSPYVLKIVRFNYLKPTALALFLEKVPFIGSHFFEKREAKQQRFWRVFRGYSVAYEKDSRYSGLIAIHLQPTEGQVPAVTLFDRYNRKYEVDLNKAAFVIQKRAVPLRNIFSELLDKGNVDLAKRRIRQIIRMYVTEYQAGIYDEDHNLLINVGFAGEDPIRMDLGKVKEWPEIKDPNVYKTDLYRIVDKRLDPWFKKNYPQYRDELRAYMDGLLNLKGA